MALTNARLGVGRLNNFRLNATTVAPPPVPSLPVARIVDDGDVQYEGEDLMAAILRQQKQHGAKIVDLYYNSASSGGHPGPVWLMSPRLPSYSLFVQSVVFEPDRLPVPTLQLNVRDDGTPPRMAFTANISSTQPIVPGERTYRTDWGPKGVQMTPGRALFIEAVTGDISGMLHIDAYQRLVITGKAEQFSPLPYVMALVQRPNPIVPQQFGEIGIELYYNKPVMFTTTTFPQGFYIRAVSSDPANYGDLGLNFAQEVAINTPTTHLFFKAVPDTRGWEGRSWLVSDASLKMGYEFIVDAATGIPVSDSFGGQSMLLKVPV